MCGGHGHNISDYPQLRVNHSPGAKWMKSLTNDRTGNFTGGHFSDINLSSVLFTHRLDDNKNPGSILAARKLADEVFGENGGEHGVDIYKHGSKEAQVWGIGHCRIDTAWLWPYHATQQKVARSWSTQVDLMERYPEHRFASSSAQQYKWLEQLYPPLLREMVRAGKFCPIGGSWVENDANMPSGEALARQLIFGQRYFESRFGMRSRVAWLPDSFGLTGALPQTIRGAEPRIQLDIAPRLWKW
ncbi:glycosyl hydrolases family 38 N-terminal domain-containing protein [Lactifluus volemus]|nr:glycosyl hydrolases family 38 N-terminal domain-containing protein [Lactifluus volemus]